MKNITKWSIGIFAILMVAIAYAVPLTQIDTLDFGTINQTIVITDNLTVGTSATINGSNVCTAGNGLCVSGSGGINTIQGDAFILVANGSTTNLTFNSSKTDSLYLDLPGTKNMTGDLKLNTGKIIFNNASVNYLQFSAGDLAISDGSHPFVWFTQTDRVGINTQTPGAPLEVSQTDISADIFLTTYIGTNQSLYSKFNVRQARGNLTNPSATLTDDVIGGFGGIGYDGTAFPSDGKGRVQIQASGNWNSTSTPTRVVVYTTPIGTTIPIERVRFMNTGTVGIGATTPFSSTAPERLYVDSGTSYNIIKGTANVDSYAQINIQNLNTTGTSASSDLVATAGNGDESNYYIDMGINGPAYNQAAYNIGGANDGYLYVQNGSLTLGTATPGKVIKFHTAGTTATNERMMVDTDGNISMGYKTSGNYTLFKSDGSMQAFGTARKWKSIDKEAYNLLGYATTISGETYAAAALATLGPYVFMTYVDTVTGGQVGSAAAWQVTNPSDRVDGTNMTLELHVMKGDGNTGNVRWLLAVRQTCHNQLMSPQTDVVFTSTNAVGGGAAYNMTAVNFVLNSSINLNLNSCVLALTIARDGEDATDTYAGSMYLNNAEFIYQTDKLGTDNP